jgi:predicted GH43/DUF377 family glycosyl hydrolase
MIKVLTNKLIYKNSDKKYTHTQFPVSIRLKDKVRIFFSKRDNNNRSQPFFIDLDPSNLSRVIYEQKKPILKFGKPGMFDDAGVMPTSIIKYKKLYYMYYIGWTTRKNIPYSNYIGLATSKNCKNFKKYSNIPLFNLSKKEPYYTASLQVIKKGIFYGAYLSCIGWKKINNLYEPIYDVKMSTSKDLINWKRDGRSILKLKKKEGGICPSDFVKINKKYFIFYSYRNAKNFRTSTKDSYKLGLAFTQNFKTWKRFDKLKIITKKNSWNNDMQCYPSVLIEDKTINIFYNGNGFGKSGIGLAQITGIDKL